MSRTYEVVIEGTRYRATRNGNGHVGAPRSFVP